MEYLEANKKIVSLENVRNVQQINIALVENFAIDINVLIHLLITMGSVLLINIALFNNTAQDSDAPIPMSVILILIVQDSIKSANLEIVCMIGQLVEAI